MLMMLRDAATKPIKEAEEEWCTLDRAMTDLEICQKWEANGEEARNRGTEAHLQMELWFNSEPTRLDDPEVGVGLQFVRDCLEPIEAKAYRTEWVIFGDEENVAGCIDLAVELPSGDLYLIDWKRSEKLKKKMKGYSRMAAPFTHLDDCSGCAYAVQLSSYQYIIEKYYGKRVAGRALASIHPTAPFTTTVPYLANEVEYLMARRRAEHGTRLRLSAMPLSDGLRCAKTNASSRPGCARRRASCTTRNRPSCSASRRSSTSRSRRRPKRSWQSTRRRCRGTQDCQVVAWRLPVRTRISSRRDTTRGSRENRESLKEVA